MSVNCTYEYKGKLYSRDRLLRLLREDNPQLSIGDFQGAVNWLKEYIGISETEAVLVKGLIDNKSLARFIDDSKTLLSEYAGINEAKHEAFHRVWRSYLTESERSDAIRSFKTDKNWAKKLDYLRSAYSDKTEGELIEEHFAREFEDYELSPESYSIEQPIKSFFKRLLNFIKKLVGLKSKDISTVYKNIYLGKYKAAKKSKSPYKGSPIDKIEIGGKPVEVEHKNEIVNYATQQILQQIIQTPQGLDAFIRSETSDNFKQAIGQVFQNIVTHLNKTNPDLSNVVIADLNEFFIKGGQSFLVNEVKKKIQQLGISILEIDSEEDNQASENDTEVNKRREFTSNIEIDPKTNMSKKVKILLASFVDESRKTPSLGFDMPIQWSQAFLRIAEKMSGVPTSEFISELRNANLPFQEQLNKFIDSPSFLFMGNDFISSLSNTTNRFNIMQFKEGEIYFFDANVNTRADRIKREWHNNLVRSINAEKSFEDWVNILKAYNKDSKTTVEEFAALLGIEISGLGNSEINENIIQLSKQIETEIKAKNFSNTNKPDFSKLYSKNNFDVDGRITKLAQLESSNVDSVDHMVYAMGKKIYSLGLNTHQTTLINGLNYAVSKFESGMTLEQKLDIVRKYAPFAVTEFNVTKINDEYVIRNKWLAKILEGNKLNLSIMYSAQTDLADEAEVFRLEEPDLMSMHINASLQGVNMSMKHSDRSTFFGYSFDDKSNLFSTDLMTNESAALDLLVESLVDQINIEKDIAIKFSDDYQPFQYFAKKYDSPGFAEILGEERFNALVNGDSISAQDKRVIKDFVSDVFKEFVEKAEEMQVPISKSVLTQFSNNRNLALAVAFVNEIAGHLEEIKLFTGDLRFYKDSVDLFKRLAAMSSTGKLLVNDQKTNDRVRTALTKSPIEIYNPITGALDEFTYNLAPDGYFRAITIAENDSYSSFLTEPSDIVSKLTGNKESKLFLLFEYNMLQDLGREATESEKKRIVKDIQNYVDKYTKVNENDGQSYMTIVSFKNYMMRLGLWNPAFENVYRAEIQVLKAKSIEDIANIEIELGGVKIKPFVINKGESFGDRKVKVGDKTFSVGFSALHTLKTQFSGYSVSEKYFNAQKELAFMANSIFKTSQHILLPSTIIGTNLQVMNHTMLSNGIDVIHMGSANKVGGIDAKLAAKNALGKEESKDKKHLYRVSEQGLQFYNDEGHFNYDAINENIDEFAYLSSYDYLKDQVAIGNAVKDMIKGSTQSLKIMLSNLIENGKERFPGAQKIADEYKQIINQMVSRNRESFLKEIGYNSSTDKFDSMSAFRAALLDSQQAKSAPDNILNAIENFILDPRFETLPGRSKIENIVYSMLTNSVISFDRPGNAYPQAAVTGYERIGTRNTKLTNQDTLKFYEPVFDSEGNLVRINPAEIIMPLPDYWIEPLLNKYKTRNIVEAISKLNKDIESGNISNQVTFKGLRIPNQQLSSNDVFKVKRFTLPTMQSYVIVPSELVVKVGSDFDIDKLNIYWSNDTEKNLFNTSIEERYQSYIKAAAEVNEEVMSFEHFSSIAKSSLDSKLLALEQEILLHPRNAHHLFMPIVDDIFSKKVYNEIQELGKIEEEKKGYLYSVAPHVNVRKSVIFVKGKLGVGVVALDITGHSTSQVDKVELQDRFLASDGNVYSTMLRFDGMQQNYSLGNYTNEDDKFITEVLSQLLTTQVDNVKDPKAVKMGINMQTLNIVGYLTRRGVSTSKIVKFIKQPLIQYYLQQQSINESLGNKANKKELPKARLIAKVISTKNLKGLAEIPEDWTFTEEELNEGLTSGKFDEFQNRLFTYFLELVEQTKAFSDYSQYQNADTKGLKDRQSVEETNLRAEKVKTAQIISKDAFQKVNTSGVISSFTQARNLYDSLYRRFYFAVTSPYYNGLFNFKEDLAGLQKTNNKKERARKQVDEDFVLYFVQKYVLNESNLMDRLLGKTEEPSLPARIRDAQAEIPENLVLRAFFPLLRNTTDPLDGEFIDNLRLFERELLTIDSNDMINSMKEIAELNPSLYYDIVHFLFFQSGTSNSPYNYFKVIPVAKTGSKSPAYEFAYQEILNQAIQAAERLVKSEDQAATILEDFKKLFQLNNPQFLRTRSFPGYPMDYKVNYVKGKPVIIDVETGQVVKGLGNSAMKRYNVTTSPNLESGRNNTIEGINIYTKSPDILGRALTNPTWGSIKDNKNYLDVETEYKKNKSKNTNPAMALLEDMSTMQRLIEAKLRQNPELIEDINSRGGQLFLERSSHIVGAKGSRWEGKGLESNFIKTLIQAYRAVASEQNKLIDSGVQGNLFDFDKSISTGILVSELYKDFINTNTIYQGEDILAFIGESEYYRALVPELLKFNKGFKFTISLDTDNFYERLVGLSRGYGKSIAEIENVSLNSNAVYSELYNETAYGPNTSQKTIIHELIHATIQKEYDSNPEFNKEIYDLWSISESYFLANNATGYHYGLSSPTEFLAEALSNPEFMQVLNEIPYNDGKSVWTYFMDLVSKFINSLLGVEFKRGSVLEQVVRLSEQVINNKQEISKHTSVSEFTVGSEVLNNFETYFPQFSYFNQEQRNVVARMVEEGKIQLTCAF